MLLKLLCVFTICYVIEITETYHLPTNSNTKYAVAKNREELINIIRSLKHHQDEYNNVDEPDTDLNDDEKEKKLQNVLWLLNKNYNAQKHFENLHKNGFHKASRLYLIKNPLALEEYKNHLKKFRRSSKTNVKNNIHLQNNLKNKLRNMRRDVIFRLGSSESYSDGIDLKEGNTIKVRDDIQEHSYNPIPQEKKEIHDLRKDVFEEYPELRDTLEMHNRNVHNPLRSDYDFRREKSKWGERHENSDTAEEDRKKKYTLGNQPSLKKNKIPNETVNWDKITTKGIPIKYKKKKILKEFEYKINHDKVENKIKNSYNRPKNHNMGKEFHSYGRTSIPIVGKRGIYEEK